MPARSFGEKAVRRSLGKGGPLTIRAGRRIKEAMKDERRYTAEEVFAELDKIEENKTEPAYWKKIPQDSPAS